MIRSLHQSKAWVVGRTHVLERQRLFPLPVALCKQTTGGAVFKPLICDRNNYRDACWVREKLLPSVVLTSRGARVQAPPFLCRTLKATSHASLVCYKARHPEAAC